MMIECEIDLIELDGDFDTIPSVCVTCSRCGHETKSYGQHERSVRRCLALLHDECPNREANYYYVVAE